MNKIQKAYATAKAAYDAASQAVDTYEARWLQSNGYGVTSLFHIDDEDQFDAACAKYDADQTAAALSEKFDACRRSLRAAENDLIEMGLQLAPAGIRESLRASKSVEVRNRLIDLAFRLDTRTVPRV